jgi:uncharacterized protein
MRSNPQIGPRNPTGASGALGGARTSPGGGNRPGGFGGPRPSGGGSFGGKPASQQSLAGDWFSAALNKKK